jgi:anti-sigma B factor antagonist
MGSFDYTCLRSLSLLFKSGTNLWIPRSSKHLATIPQKALNVLGRAIFAAIFHFSIQHRLLLLAARATVPVKLSPGDDMELKIAQRNVNGVTVVDCNGRIIFGDEAALLRETIKAMLPQTRQIVLNLKNVTYIDSGGLGTLVGLFSSAQASGAEVKLAQLTSRSLQLLQVTKLLTVFDVKETEEQAIQSFSKAASV